MNISLDATVSLPGYCLIDRLYQGTRTIVYRAKRLGDQQSVVIKFLEKDYPNFNDLLQFRNQYIIAKNLHIPGIIQPYSLEPYGNRYALVMEDFGGMSLGEWIKAADGAWIKVADGATDGEGIQNPKSKIQDHLVEVLAIAIQLTKILDKLHQARVIHKDLKPANILIHPETGEVKLIDFSISSLLPKETQEIKNPNGLEGTLAYLSPEQTGRMNRGIDYRSDFYSLGVTLYELFTGQLPFQSEDPMELVHCHLAKQAPRLAEFEIRNSKFKIPQAISDIVTKLMAKNAEDRYQSALGLTYDLQSCLHQLQQTGTVQPFQIGTRDVCDRFLIPEKLYGRETEVAELLAAFDRVAGNQKSSIGDQEEPNPTPHSRPADGSAEASTRALSRAVTERAHGGSPLPPPPHSELILVAGFSGIGKTVVINEVHKPIARQRGYFIKGKFDQFNRNIPLSAFVQAFRDLMGQLLSESDTQLATWKNKILLAVGENGQVIVEVIPELEWIIGRQPSVPQLSGNAAQNRFNLLFQKFIQVFTAPEHPLVIFLDDLQWADSASLNLLQLLMGETSSGYLLILGAYRDNEVFPAHPLMLTLEQIEKTGSTIHTITLNPLAEPTVNQFVADTLNCSHELAKPLSQLVYQKTQGNPFFTSQFLKALHEDGWIQFQPESGCWHCEMTAVRQLALTDDVVEFMALQLQKLPAATQEVLQLAACIGSRFDLQTLAIASEQSQTETAIALWKALQDGLILPISEHYKFFQADDSGDLPLAKPTQSKQIDGTAIAYHFLHDRVQQAAYTLIPEPQKQQTHLKIGRLLLQDSSRSDHLFEILGHFNISTALVTDSEERQSLIRLNLVGCQRAKTSTAYSAAVRYASEAMSLLPTNSWQTDYPLTLQIYEAAAEVAYLNTEFDNAKALIGTILSQCNEALDCIKSYEILIQVYIAQDYQLKAIETGLEALERLKIVLFQNSNWSECLPQVPSEDDLNNRPTMVEPIYLAALQILITITPPAHHVKPDLFPLIVLTMVNLCSHAGYSGLAAYVYGIYGLLLCALLGDLEAAHRSGQVSLALLERYHAREVQAKANMLFAVFVCACKESGQTTLPLLKQGIEVGLEVGDIEHVSYSIMAYFTHLFLVGKPLELIDQSRQIYLPLLEQFKQEHCIEYTKIWLQIADEFTVSKQDVVGNSEILEHFECTHNHQCLFAFHVAQLISKYAAGDYMAAVEHAVRAIESQEAAFGILLTSAHTFYYTLALLALISTQTTDEIALETIIANQAKLKYLADHAPENYLHKFEIVSAEIHRIHGQKTNAIELYDRAIAGANANGYIQEEALANELAAKFYLEWGKEKVAAGYMQEAYYGYVRWGAKAKTDDLEQRYPQLLRPILSSTTQSLNPLESLASIASPKVSIHSSTKVEQSSTTSINTMLDFATILKASQSLSSTIQLDELLHQLTQIILQHSGGDRCALILPNETGEWQVRAISTPENTELCVDPLTNSLNLPVKLIQYAKNTQEVVVINDLETDLPVIDDYLRQRQPKSLLCLPILNQGHLIGILYLKNRLTSGVFTHDRILILNFLCTQAAISLENARLYTHLQASERRFQSLAANVLGGIYQFCLKPDGSTAFTYMSPGCQRLYEISAEEAMADANRLFQMVHPEDLENFQARIAQSAQTLEPWIWEGRYLLPSGQLKWLHAESRPHMHPDGCIFWDGMVMDVSDRKRAAEALEQFQTKLTFLIQSTPMAVIEWNPDFEVVGWNPAAEKIFGYAAEEMLHHHAIQIVPEPYQAYVIEIMQALILQKGGTYSVNENVTKDGRVIICEWINTPLVDEQGCSMGIYSMVQDITDRKQAEASLQQKSEELQQALQELQQTQLQMVQSEKMSALGNLVAGVAHEINNPIGCIIGNVDAAQNYINDLLGVIDLYAEKFPQPGAEIEDELATIDLDYVREDLPKLIRAMKDGGDRIKAISHSLRTFSRADSDTKQKFNLHHGIESTVLILRHRLKANNQRPAIEVMTEYGEIPMIECFPGQLNQVFMNILANAIDALDESNQDKGFAEIEANPNRITIRTILEGERVKITIADNGPGISDDIKARIFDHLFTTKGVGKGTGLGLAIAHQIVVEKHGGTIAVASTVGQGTEFFISLPIKDKSQTSPRED
jgi:PAS domain S-box-containing protein